MYGYVVPDKSTLRASDFVLYRAFYCGICCRTGKNYGQLPRFTTNYDFAFLSALLHDCLQSDIVIEEHKCVLNVVKKKAVLVESPLLDRLVAANIMLAYKKADDGVIDGDGFKYRVVRRALKKAYKKAAAAYPEICETVERGYKAQGAAEKNNVCGIDRAADPFASLMRELAEKISGGKIDDKLKSLCYNIGKFVYLADALDDLADDVNKKRYNPFAVTYGLNKKNFEGRKKFFDAHKDELNMYLGSCAGRAAEMLGGMRLTQSYSLLHNIVGNGLRAKIDELLSSDKKLRPPRI